MAEEEKRCIQCGRGDRLKTQPHFVPRETESEARQNIAGLLAILGYVAMVAFTVCAILLLWLWLPSARRMLPAGVVFWSEALATWSEGLARVLAVSLAIGIASGIAFLAAVFRIRTTKWVRRGTWYRCQSCKVRWVESDEGKVVQV